MSALAVVAGVALLGVPSALAATFTVTTTADAGAGSLRQAILDANALPGGDTIAFAIPGAGEHVIQPVTALPVVTDGVVIDGGAQVDAGGFPLVRIDGGAGAAPALYGLELDVAGVLSSTVNKLAFTRWDTATGAGLYIHGVGTALVTGNLVGTDAVGSAGLGNASGVIVENASLVGGAAAGQANVISGNLGAGIRMLADVTDTAVSGNRIGTTPSGVGDLGNGGAGISIEGAFDNGIGGTGGEGNVIAFNGTGVVVTGGTGNAIRRNSVFSNDNLGIDLGNDGVTPNDPAVNDHDGDTGPNGLQNYPVLDTAAVAAGQLTVAGQLASAQTTTYSIDVFTSVTCDASGSGEGSVYNGSFDVTTNVDGVAIFSESVAAGGGGQQITATATDPAGNTSEFSACVTSTGDPPSPGATFTVTTFIDDLVPGDCTADCSLREAIVAANASPNDPGTTDRIEFAIPGSGVQTIVPPIALPAIVDPVVIDGTTQGGVVGGPAIFINGMEASCGECGVDGLTVTAGGGGSTIRGIAIGNFDGWGVVLSGGSGSVVEESWIGLAPPLGTAAGNLSGGIQILDSSGNLIGGAEPQQRVVLGSNGAFGAQISISGLASGNKVEGSYIGIGPDGGDTFNTPSGVRITSGASGNTIGGSSDEARGNLIGGFSTAGVVLDGAGSGNVIAGNLIGIDGAEGTAPPIGVSVVDTPATVVGDDVSPPGFANPGFGNVIGDATTAGISISGTSTGTKVTGNFVGVDRTGAITTIGNNDGIVVTASNNTIGPGNTIAHNTANGVEIDGETVDGNRIVANSIYENGGLGIDLQSFSNNALAIPTLATAETIGAATTVEGTMSATDGTYFVEFFTNAACDGVSGGEGRTYVGFATAVVAGETGSFTGILPALPAGTVLTATVTSGATNDTSEFSACATVTAAVGETVVTLEPEADTYVDAAATETNFGDDAYFDTYGGFSASCVPHTAPAYGLLRFNVSGLPSGEIVDARLVLTSRAGYAQDGDPNHHAIFLPDDAWDESAVTWNNRPSDGTVTPGDPTLTGGGDIRVSDLALGADFVWRGTCGLDPAGDQTKVFPTNSDTAKTLDAARDDMIATVGAERDGDGRLSLELYNPNCVSCPGGANLGYWARYYSREALDAALRPKLVVTFAEGLSVTSFTAAPANPIAGIPEVRLADVPPSVLLQPSSTASTPLADTPLADTPLADTPLSDTPLADTPLGDTPLADTSLGLGDLLAELRTVPLSSLPLLREGGWPAVLDGTPLAFRALQNVTLGEVLALTPPPVELDRQGDDDIRLEELDFARSPLGDVAAIAFALGNGVTLSELSGAVTDGKLDPALELWCAVTGTNCPSTSILALGLRGAPLSDTPLADTPLSDTPLADTPLGDTPLSDTPLSDTPLGDTPLSDTPLSDTPLGDTPLSDTPLGDTPLSDTPLGDTPLSDTPLSDTPLGDTPLSDTNLNGAPLQDTPLADTPLSDTPLSDTPLSDTLISDLQTCTLLFLQCPPASDTVGQHRAELLPGKTIRDLLNAMSAAARGALTLGDFVASLPKTDAFTVERVLAMLEPPSAYTFAQVAAIFTEASGVTLADLVASLPTPNDLTLADLVASLPTPNDFTLNDLLLAVLRAGAQWERLDVTQPALARVAIGGGVVNLGANLSVAGPASVLTFTVDLPRGWTSIDPSGSIETVPPGSASALEIVSVAPMVGGGSRHTLRTQFAVGGDLRFSWAVRPGTTLGPASPSLSVSTASGTSAGAPATALSVRETFEPNNDPGTAPALTPERLYLSYLTSASDADYFRFAVPAVAGTRTTFRLSHLPADYDLVVYGPAVDPLVAGGTGVPLETPVLGDSGVPITHLTESLPAETLDDLTLLAGRRVVGVSAFRSTEDEAVVVISDGAPGEYVVQVTGYNGATNVEPYMVRVETAAPRLAPTCVARFPNLSFGSAGGVAPLPADVDTVFLVNGPQLTAMGAGAVLNWFTPANLDRLRATGHPSALVRLENDPAVRAAYAAWNAQPCSTARANAVVRAITGVVGALRQGKPLRNVVLLGADTAIPFARLDDLTTIANEADYAGTFGRSDDLYGSLFEHKLLSDDPYGTTDPIPYLQRQLFVPQLAVGRLVETPAQITGALDRFLAFDGVLDPTSARTSGYDFLKDGAAGVAAAFADVVGAQQPTTSPPLVGDLWTRSTLAGALGTGTGLFGMNGHADHFRLQPARDGNGDGVFEDADLFSAADLPTSLERAAVFSMGCHSGLSASDVSVAGAISGDWAQAFAERGAAGYVGNLGYGYGDTTTVAYSEALNVRLAEGLRDGLPIGAALVAAKQGHLAELGIVGVYDEKAMAELALYGLPMWSLDGGTAQATATATAAATAADLPAGVTSLGTETDTLTGLDVDRYRSQPTLAQITAAGGRYWEGPSGVQVTHLRPLQPKTQFDVADDAHGVLITGLVSNDVAGVDPVYARPIVDSSTAEPELPFADVAFPAKIQTLITQRTLDGTRVSAVLVQGQFFSDDTVDVNGAGVQRLFTSVDADVLRSASTDRLAPRLDRIEATVLPAAGSVAFAVEATDLPGEVAGEVKRVLVAFRETSSATWRFLDLTRGSAATWTGAGSLPAATTATRVEYFVQAVDEAGNVAVSTNKGLNYVGAPAPPATGAGVVPAILGQQTAGWYTDEPTFAVTADAGVAVEVSLDGAAFVPYTGPISIAGDGVRTIRVRASNGYEATLAVPIDTVGPAIEIASPEAGAAYLPGELEPSFACRDAGIGVATCTIAADTTTVGPHTAIVTAADALGHTTTRSVSYAVVDLPAVGPITIEPSVVPLGTAVKASAPFTDPSALDTHTALWRFGDGTTAVGTIVESGGSGTATATHVYAAPGVYTVSLVVTDQLGGASEEVFYSYVVVYDPKGGFVTGGGWITSPPGAYPADPALTGKASFGFVSKYKQGQTVPDGNTEFHFRAAELLFRSTSYEWLVVAGARAQFKGAGSVNGQSGYDFLLTATDGQVKGGGGVDRFRIKIWKVGDGVVVYDNQLGAADDAEPATAIDSGSIVIRK